jgi:hypothetical protein
MPCKLRRVKMPGVAEPRDRFLFRHPTRHVRHDEGRHDEGRDKQQREHSTETLRGLV